MRSTIRRTLIGSFGCLAVAAAGCDGNTDDESSESEVGEETGDVAVTCELIEAITLTDADEIAPNGKTGAEILAVIPEQLQTTLHWDLSNGDVMVEVAGAAGQSSALELSFSLPADPTFVFEDWLAVDPDGEPVPEGEVECEDYVRTTLDLSAQTMDGALAIDLTEVGVRLGSDHPEFGVLAAPFVLETIPLSSPDITFTSPVSRPADDEKTLTVIFEDQGVSGAVTAYATASDQTHQIVVARW